MTATIRRATTVDLPWLRRLYEHFCAEVGAPYPTVDAEELDRFVLAVSLALVQDPGFCIMVAEDDHGTLVGFLGVGILTRAVGKPQQLIAPHWLYVVPSHRGQGVSRQLVAHALAWYRAHWPQVVSIEILARAMDPQWADRGFVPFMVYHHGPLSLAEDYVTGTKTSDNGKPKSMRAGAVTTDAPEDIVDG